MYTLQRILTVPGWLTVLPPIVTAVVAIVFRYMYIHDVCLCSCYWSRLVLCRQVLLALVVGIWMAAFLGWSIPFSLSFPLSLPSLSPSLFLPVSPSLFLHPSLYFPPLCFPITSAFPFIIILHQQNIIIISVMYTILYHRTRIQSFDCYFKNSRYYK